MPQLIGTFLPLIAIFAVMYILMIRPQKKREQEIKTMRANLKIGDKIITIGGIKGKIVLIKEDYLIIESSGNKTQFEIMKWGINSVITNTADLKEEPQN